MSVTENLTVPMHQQDTSYYCGAACAQMVLETIGAGILDQDDLYSDNHSHSTIESGWYTGPDGLQWTLLDRRPPSFTNYFALYALDTEDLISRKLCWTIHHYQVAPIALVYGWAHWIVVRGYTASAHPASSADNSYTIDAFDINNPWPPVPSEANPALAPPPPHSAGDGCGTGGDRGVANEHVTYATWQSTYMTGVPGGYWNGKFVAVCDPEPPAARGGPMRQPSRRRGKGELLEPKTLSTLALAGLREYGLLERKDWAQVLGQARPQPGVMVQRLDRLDSFYALVGFEAKKGTVAFAAVDGRWGDYMQATLLPKPQSERTRLTREQAFKRIAGKRLELGGQKGRLLVRKEAVCSYPHLVWRPCMESLSPYYPFYLFTVGNERVYVRIDGAVFTSLTLDLRGI
ncbi:hypothetical protein JY651_47795 [Pyxidicoccus parkwayensis]|uniref:Peptidase C39-like domain-containing protein n=1 Tax=Pyxidicoccus parkwayensis TaxID=2813578 RepID=A0ABX7NV27_9BACT|nr:hypothetical protein [Pyxidicoccus parkwaysis]QSQ22724.1 hypothetical protein JY651_47795 [Pyxidicoccus parkwaysis]